MQLIYKAPEHLPNIHFIFLLIQIERVSYCLEKKKKGESKTHGLEQDFIEN